MKKGERTSGSLMVSVFQGKKQSSTKGVARSPEEVECRLSVWSQTRAGWVWLKGLGIGLVLGVISVAAWAGESSQSKPLPKAPPPSARSSPPPRRHPPPRYYYYYSRPYWPYPPPPAYPYYYTPYYYTPYYGSIFVDPAAVGYGPRGAMRVMGVEHWFSGRSSSSSQQNWGGSDLLGNRVGTPRTGQLPGQPGPDQPPGEQEGDNDPPHQPRKPLPPRGGNPPGVGQNPQRAMLLVDFGDAHFANKKYAEALQRYQEAVQLDAELPEAHLHMGFALLAMGKYDQAVQAFQRGLELNPNWPASSFRLQQLYGPPEGERLAHRNALARAAAAKPNDANLLFLLGIMFYFDQMPDQARRCFVEAARLAGDKTAHLDPFLRRL